MNRQINVERLYNLGQYKNIRFSDGFINIPQQFAMNSEVVAKLQLLALLSAERGFIEYQNLISHINKMSLEDTAIEIDRLRGETFESLKEMLNGELENPTNGEE